jgi:hypothetical protein
MKTKTNRNEEKRRQLLSQIDLGWSKATALVRAMDSSDLEMVERLLRRAQKIPRPQLMERKDQ